MTNLKAFLSSKINWAAIILILVSLQDAISNANFSTMTKQNWITFGLGILVMVFRTFFTSADSALNKKS